jgi:hypothetical protein
MSKQQVLDFFAACAADEAMLERYSTKQLPSLLLHVRLAGYDISQKDLTDVIGAMEVDVIMQRMGEQIDGNSSLWRQMWGRPRLRYVIDGLYRTYGEDELAQFAD